jgi:hypothetical protein
MTHPMDDNFVIDRGIEDEVRVGMNDDPPKAAHARKLTGLRMGRDEVGDRLNPRLDPTGAARRTVLDV